MDMDFVGSLRLEARQVLDVQVVPARPEWNEADVESARIVFQHGGYVADHGPAGRFEPGASQRPVRGSAEEDDGAGDGLDAAGAGQHLGRRLVGVGRNEEAELRRRLAVEGHQARAAAAPAP